MVEIPIKHSSLHNKKDLCFKCRMVTISRVQDYRNLLAITISGHFQDTIAY